ncbi:MAG: hypothetical protein K0V04_31070 [Deltaproteobacteria bacterium]|nr:hypothetical protein [Deltaproteobacteria bacterium]
MTRFRAIAWSVALPLAACAQSDSEPDPVAADPISVESRFTNVTWMTAPTGEVFLLDTGSPRTQVIPEVLGLADNVFDEVIWDDPFGFNVDRQAVLASGDLPLFLKAVPGFSGIIGADMLSRRPFIVDTHGGEVVLGEISPSEVMERYDVEPPSVVPIEVLGGSRTCFTMGCIEWEANRIIVPVTIDGVASFGVVDTGMGNVTVSGEFFERHLAERPVPSFEMEDLVDPQFTQAAPVVMIHTLAERLVIGDLGEQDVRLDIPPRAAGLDAALSRLSVEVGVKVEVLLGNSLFARFLTQVDYEAQELRLYRYRESHPTVGRLEGTSVFASESVGGVGFSDAPIGGTYDGRCLYAVRAVVGGEGSELGLADAESCFLSIAGFDATDSDRLAELPGYLDGLAVGDPVEVTVAQPDGEPNVVTLHVQQHLARP